ncbi:hypothetical protein D3C81_254750 [compost metagenome]
MHARFVKSGAVMGHVVIGVLERPFHAFELQRLQFILAGALDRLEVIRCWGSLDHLCLLNRFFNYVIRCGSSSLLLSLQLLMTSPATRIDLPRKSAMARPSWLLTLTS